MSVHPRSLSLPDKDTIDREARRILRRLSESDAVLVVSPEMDKAVVLRCKEETPVRTGLVDRSVAQAFALQDWIGCKKKGRVHQYEITQAGRTALKRLIAADQASRTNRPIDAFAEQHRDFEARTLPDPSDPSRMARLRVNLAESPLLLLSRRKDRAGTPFLTEELVIAGERLREDFELAQMGPSTCQNWERFLTAGADASMSAPTGPGDGPTAARNRVMDALRALGPGLSDIVLRCCCFLEGVEAAERRMGWSARSGKIVLRIGLQRLAQFYADGSARRGAIIG